MEQFQYHKNNHDRNLKRLEAYFPLNISAYHAKNDELNKKQVVLTNF
jgi:hypothetical protein